MIELVGFDGDDTLSHSEGYYRAANAEFERVVGAYLDLGALDLHDRLLAAERRNLKLFGYGAKGMTLSMLEAAIGITDARISAADIQCIIDLGKQVLDHPVELLAGIRDAVQAVAARQRIVLITKGDLFHQQRKVAQCGLAGLFQRIEIVSEKDPAAYRRVLDEFSLQPEQFAMVGNSLRSDIASVVGLGGWGVYMPYHVTWALETLTDFNEDSAHVVRVDAADAIDDAVAEMNRRAAA